MKIENIDRGNEPTTNEFKQVRCEFNRGKKPDPRWNKSAQATKTCLENGPPLKTVHHQCSQPEHFLCFPLEADSIPRPVKFHQDFPMINFAETGKYQFRRVSQTKKGKKG